MTTYKHIKSILKAKSIISNNTKHVKSTVHTSKSETKHSTTLNENQFYKINFHGEQSNQRESVTLTSELWLVSYQE